MSLVIREMYEEDIYDLFSSCLQNSINRELKIFENYYKKQLRGNMLIIIAVYEKKIVGYMSILFNAETGPFKNKNIPEFGDFNVFKKFQSKGIGNQILEYAENIVKQNYSNVSLAVGLNRTYGQAQRLYIKRGYIPDGSGVWYEDEPLEPYAMAFNNDDLALYLIKKLV